MAPLSEAMCACHRAWRHGMRWLPALTLLRWLAAMPQPIFGTMVLPGGALQAVHAWNG